MFWGCWSTEIVRGWKSTRERKFTRGNVFTPERQNLHVWCILYFQKVLVWFHTAIMRAY